MGTRAALLSLFAAACGASGDTADTDVDADVGVAIDAAFDATPGGSLLVESFAAGAGSTWPIGWTELGGVASATVENGRGALVPAVSSYTLGRMGHALPAGAVDVEVTFTLTMSEPGRQGVGFYVRQNGGHLTSTTPRGAGYAVFVEAFRGPQIGLWRERDGAEESLQRVPVPALDAGVAYAVRFRCVQEGASTSLAARVWPVGTTEPSAWTVTTTDATPALQLVSGGVAVDAWNTVTPGGGGPPGPIHVDDITVTSP